MRRRRRRLLEIGIVVLVALVLGGAYGAARLKRYVDTDPGLCAHCHRASLEFALWTKGSHVFDDDQTQMFGASGKASLGAGANSRLTFTASYVQWRDVDRLELKIRRQNSRGPDGRLALELATWEWALDNAIFPVTPTIANSYSDQLADFMERLQT